MNKRPPEPEYLIQWREWAKAGPPKCCHTCDNYSGAGDCLAFEMRPPEDFAATQGACDQWIAMIPF